MVVAGGARKVVHSVVIKVMMCRFMHLAIVNIKWSRKTICFFNSCILSLLKSR